jgi:SAM-dependent methyltransferase
MATAKTAEYGIGTGPDELERLGLQHQLWSDTAHALWRMARVGPTDRVLDVGCGPGYASFDLAQIVGSGAVVGVDESPSFIEHLAAQARTRALPQLTGLVGDVQRLPELLPRAAGTFDLAYARWVLCFVADPEAVVAGVASLLRPGGRFAVHDYFNYSTTTTAPRRQSYDKVVAATTAWWRARGGDPDVCGRLPRFLAAHGFSLEHLAVHQWAARGRDSMFHWPHSWWRSFAPKLVEQGYFSRPDCDALLRDLEEIKSSEVDFLLPPPVTEMLAIKR